MLLLLLALACDPGPAPAPPRKELPFEQREITQAGMVAAFPASRVKDREGWAKDTLATLRDHDIPATNLNACAVVAVVEQESGYDPNPAVPGIGGMIDTWIEQKQAELGKVQGFALDAGLKVVLSRTPEGQTASFYDRLKAAKTERDVDLVYRELVAYQRARLPKPLQRVEAAASSVGFSMDDYNPISTAGCMQVKVDQAEAHAAAEGLDVSGVRDSMYTRAGCLHYGVVRLLDWDADYDMAIYRFADFNAGLYTSRNAALQGQISAITGAELALDGDLLRYEHGGRPSSTPSSTLSAVLGLVRSGALTLTERRVRLDLEQEKRRGLEQTETWAALRALYEQKTGKKPAYARMPNVALDSIKLAGDKSTSWFANNVAVRYDKCIARVKAGK